LVLRPRTGKGVRRKKKRRVETENGHPCPNRVTWKEIGVAVSPTEKNPGGRLDRKLSKPEEKEKISNLGL